MSINTINPFNITKAVDYSDEEINKYWVDISEGNGFVDMLKPSSPMPLYILGGKGSGKTHIMRYFSFNLQKIRYENKLIESIEGDKYIGVFLRCGGLNSSKFSGNNQSADAWKNIFAYYVELWFAQLLINIISEIFEKNPKYYELYEHSICKEISKLFDIDVSEEFNSIQTFNLLLQKLQKQVDYEVNNSAITGRKVTEIRILVSPGKLIFGLPNVLEKLVPFLKEVQFIYLIDEYENLLHYQQRYVNTLIREREAPVSFRIGARWYGIKTYNTYSGNEDLKEGSEYEKYVIDNILRKNELGYEKYAKQICITRLNQAGFDLGTGDIAIKKLEAFFEEFNLDKFFLKLKNKEPKIGTSYFFKLKELLSKTLSEKNVEEIITNLKVDNNPLFERTNVLLFYREWKNYKDLINSSKKIKSDYVFFLQNPKDPKSLHKKVLDKFRNDLIDQLHRESREPLSYSGIDRLIKMSAGIPRLLLIMLKHIYRWAIYNDENPFNNNCISESSQRKGLQDASKWFLEDARVAGDDGKIMSSSINRIGEYMQEIRFSNVPPECSLSSFSIKVIDIDEAVEKTLLYLEQYSYLIKVDQTREKNSPVQRITYQINGLLAPIWELPIYRRGILHLTTDEVTVIFKSTTDIEYNKIKNSRLSTYNAPFKGSNSPTLFES